MTLAQNAMNFNPSVKVIPACLAAALTTAEHIVADQNAAIVSHARELMRLIAETAPVGATVIHGSLSMKRGEFDIIAAYPGKDRYTDAYWVFCLKQARWVRIENEVA